ncbi:immunoglobulin-like domain-containing protein [Hyalangium minutum]|uniref:HYR domain-containing protein n=1 Tax=Hyalangium minutum TaxID=394096 RepID=A0A085WH41_9BACT|nr:immunoglobulin-like domain-containing protein [Hyalangium minutum]KFE67004.1 hypothetical protein DB31_8357 [Hyalangium minutum]
MTSRVSWGAVLLSAAMTVTGCGEEPSELSAVPEAEATTVATHTAIQALASTDKVLILGSSVSGGAQSREAQAVAALSPSTQVDVVSAEQWRAMTAQQFMSYRAIIIGDAACQSGTAAFQAAVDTRNVWGPMIDGTVALASTNLSSNGTPHMLENAIAFALDSPQQRTGMYVSLGCAYQSAAPNTAVQLLEPLGVFKVSGLQACANAGHIFEMNTGIMTRNLSDSQLSSSGCVARSVFTQYPDRNFSFVAVARNTSGASLPGQQSYTDYMENPEQETSYNGTPYLLVRGASTLSAGCGLSDYSPAGEECDMGDGWNGQAAVQGQNPLDTCSYTCRNNWCGDGVVDANFGEECDNGNQNGRLLSSAGALGNCSSACKLIGPSSPPPSNPPVARCKDAVVSAGYTCGVYASVDNGSYDPDNDLVSCTQSPDSVYGLGTTAVTLTCRDAQSHVSTCNATVTVVDNTPPVVTLNGSASHTLECNRNLVYPDQGATGQDACSGALPTVRSGVVNMAQASTYSLTYTATDGSGNQGSATRSVTVADTLAPTLTLLGAASVTAECGTAFNDPGAAVSDQCVNSISATRSGALNLSAPGAYTLRYDARDPSNNAAAFKTRTVTVRDTLKPTVTVQGALNQAVECGSAYTDPGATVQDQCATSLAATATGSVNASQPGTYTLSYRAVDPSGNVGTATSSRTVTVSDTLAPALTLNGPASLQLECATPYTDLGATAQDLCAGSVAVTSTGSVNNRQLGPQTISYSANDGRGHTASATRTVTVADTRAPAITVQGSLNTTYECGSTYVDLGATASDACAGSVPVTATQTSNPNQPGSFTITYSAVDPSGNSATSTATRTVSVNDSAPPTLVLNGPATQSLECGSSYEDPGALAQDACFGDVTARITRSGSVNASAPGTYALTYNVTDPAGQAAPSVSRTVNVSDTLAPTLTVQGSLNAQVECGTAYNDAGATASDVCAGNLNSAIRTTSNVNTSAPGGYTVSYAVTDASGNSASGGRAVTVRDTQAPVITPRPGPSTLECNGTPYVELGATANDACRGDLSSAITTTSNLDQTRSGTYNVTYRVADASGNVGTAVRMLTVGPCSTNSCTNIRLGDYNLFLQENYTGGHDVVGKVAAGGNISMTDFSVGMGLPSSNLSNTLVAGGNLSLSRGSIGGDAWYGGTLTADQSVSQSRGVRRQGTPIDFAAKFSELRGLTGQLANMTATGTTRRESWGGISMTGNRSTVNVFDISASAFTGAVYWQINAPAGSLVVVNIRGSAARFTNFGIQFSGGIDQHGVLFNFVDTTSITASGFGFWGTVLAPYADVNFNNGSWDGGIYAKSFTGNAEGHINPLNDRDICP